MGGGGGGGTDTRHETIYICTSTDICVHTCFCLLNFVHTCRHIYVCMYACMYITFIFACNLVSSCLSVLWDRHFRACLASEFSAVGLGDLGISGLGP